MSLADAAGLRQASGWHRACPQVTGAPIVDAVVMVE